LKEEALDRTLWRTRFGRGYGPVVRQTTEWMNVSLYERYFGTVPQTDFINVKAKQSHYNPWTGR
jgi:hypothetical protein